MPHMLRVKFKVAHGEFKKGDYADLPEPLVREFLDKVEVNPEEPQEPAPKAKAKTK